MLELSDDVLESLKQIAPRARIRKKTSVEDDPLSLDLLKQHKSTKSGSAHTLPPLPKSRKKKNILKKHSSSSEVAGRGILFKLLSRIGKGKENELGVAENTPVDASFPPLRSKTENLTGLLGGKHKGVTSIEDTFCLEKVVTRECFGELWVAAHRRQRNKKNREPLLLRLMAKRDCSTDTVAKELETIKSLNNIDFTAQLISYFQTLTHYVIAMRHATNGTLNDRVMMVRAFSEIVARFYAAEMAEALFGLHYKGIIHRCLSLDNVLICDNGHLVVSDFGHSLQIDPDEEPCEPWPEGSTLPQFPAPELLMLETYDKTVDWWAYGNIVYRMISGEFPFPAVQEYAEVQDVESELEVIFKPEAHPYFISPCATHFFRKLLHRNRRKRLGNGQQEEYDVTNVTFFKHVDWSLLRDHLIPPPFNFMCHAPPTRKCVSGRYLPYTPEEKSKVSVTAIKKESVETLSPAALPTTDVGLQQSSFSFSAERPPRTVSLPESTEVGTDGTEPYSQELVNYRAKGRGQGVVTFDLTQEISQSSSNIVTQDKTSERKSTWSSTFRWPKSTTGVQSLSSSSRLTLYGRFRSIILSSIDTIRRRRRSAPRRSRFDSK